MPNVLIVEDDLVSSEMLELALLGLPGVCVRTLSSAEEATAALASTEAIDAVITDVHLPGQDGLTLVKTMLGMPERSATPVIVVTSSREPELRKRAEAMGVRAFLEKPWSPNGLRDTVNSLFNGH